MPKAFIYHCAVEKGCDSALRIETPAFIVTEVPVLIQAGYTRVTLAIKVFRCMSPEV